MYTFKEYITEAPRTKEELEEELKSILDLLEPPLCPTRVAQYGNAKEYKKMLLHKKRVLETALKNA